MRVTFFSSQPYEQQMFTQLSSQYKHELHFQQAALSAKTAAVAHDCDAVCVFVNDNVDAACIAKLAALGIKSILLRCAGFNNVDIAAASKANIVVANVPVYSPHAVAEYA